MSAKYRRIVLGFSLLFLIAIFQYTVNNSMDIEFIKHVLIIPVLNLFAGLLLYAIIGKDGQTFGRLCDFILIAALVQAIISFAMFISPELTKFVHSIIVYDDRTEMRHETLTHRLMGIGQAFWGAGINYGVDMLILAVLPDVKGSFIYKYKILYWTIAAVIILAGILSARTFFISFIFVLLYFIFMRKNILSMVINSYKYILIIPLFFIFYQLLETQIGGLRFQEVESFTFEMYNNYEETGEFESGSTNMLGDMYNIFPTTTKTWLIGDGKFKNEDGSYYMRTDIGYSRQIFFYGLIGLIPYWIIILLIYRVCVRQYRNNAIKIFLCVLFLFEMTLNFKALASLSSYLGLFLAWGVMNMNHAQEIIRGRILEKYINRG